MLLPITKEVNSNGHLIIGGCDVCDLGKKYGTPLYILDIKTIKGQCRSYKESFNFPDTKTEMIYASKAFASIALCQLIKKEGLSIDVSSGGELYTAVKSGFLPEKIYFHGNNKTVDEINYGLKEKVGCFIVDNFYELEILEKLCAKKDIRQKIMLRITPGIKAYTHKYIETGSINSKFGFSMYGDIAFDAVKKVSSMDNLELIGLHSHIGSQIFNLSCYGKLINIMFRFLKELKDKLNLNINQLNIGGGLGIKYIPEDKPSSIDDLSKIVYKAVKDNEKKYDIRLDKIYIEPGRSIVGNAGLTLYEVGVVKEIPKVKNYICVDGGMSDNIRPILYQAKYYAYIASRMNSYDTSSNNKGDSNLLKRYSIVGKHCESGDVIIEDIILPEVKTGDLIAVGATGAYCYSMASNYNGQPKSAVIAVENGKSWIWTERQVYKDLIIKDRKLYE